MGYYLQMDGVDDRVVLPSMTFTEIVLDFRINSKSSFERYWSLPLGAEYFQVASGGINDQWSTGVSAVYLNGSAQVNTTPFMVIGTRAVARSVLSAAKTAVISIFANGTGNIAHGDLWDIKVYNGSTLQAHYDMSTGTVNDQSGNGNHATLIGGTWVQDGPVGTAGSVSYATKQVISQSGSVDVSTKQIVSQIGADSYATGQTIYQPGDIDVATKQAIYASSSVSYPTLQIIMQGGIAGAISFATRQAIYSAGAAAYPTRQSIYASGAILLPTRQNIYRIGGDPAATRQIIYRPGTDLTSVKLAIFQASSIDLPTQQVIYDELKLIVSRVSLLANRALRIGLLASRELRIELGGDLSGMKKNQNFEMERGESLYIDFTAAGIDDLTSATVMWAMKKSNASEPYLLKDTASGIEVTGDGSFTVSLTMADTENFPPGIYYHEAYVIDAQQHKSPVASGVITLTLGLI